MSEIMRELKEKIARLEDGKATRDRALKHIDRCGTCVRKNAKIDVCKNCNDVTDLWVFDEETFSYDFE